MVNQPVHLFTCVKYYYIKIYSVAKTKLCIFGAKDAHSIAVSDIIRNQRNFFQTGKTKWRFKQC